MNRVVGGRYELFEVIGAGGVAAVHRGIDRLLDREVAVKVLDDAAARSADPAGRDRFLAEARSSARFDHPNIVTVLDAGEDDGVLYMVMELVRGATLAEVIARRAPLPVDESVAIACQVLAALAAAHEHGIVHRDVKPANILVDPGGRVRLADFGIAKRLDDMEDALTSAGTVVGTPNYMAPEQQTGSTLGAPTDVFLAGLVLHEMLTGAAPAAARHGHLPLDPRTERADVPDPVADVVVRATHPDPGERFPRAEAMRSALEGGSIAPGVLQAAAPNRRGDTEVMPASSVPAATVVGAGAAPSPVPPGASSGPSRRSGRGLAGGAVFGLTAAALLLIAGVGAFGGSDPGDVRPPSTTVTPVDPVIVTVAPTTSPTTVAPVAVAGDDGGDGGGNNGKANGKGNGKGKGRGD